MKSKSSTLEMRLLLTKYIREAQKTKQKLIKKFQVPIDGLEIQLNLADHFELDESVNIVFKDLNARQMFDILKGYNFSKPTYSKVISLKKSVLPLGLPRLLTEETIKSKGEQWRINMYDKDIFPSNPHAHNLDANVKLHLGTGELFQKRKLVGKLKQKDLMAIRIKVKNIKLPTLAKS